MSEELERLAAGQAEHRKEYPEHWKQAQVLERSQAIGELPLPLPPDAVELRSPVTMKVGSFVEMDFDAYLELNGLVWLRVQGGFGDGQRTNWHPREDWIALVPGVCVSVTRYFDEPDNWKSVGIGATIYDAMRYSVESGVDNARYRLAETEQKLRRLERGLRMLIDHEGAAA